MGFDCLLIINNEEKLKFAVVFGSENAFQFFRLTLCVSEDRFCFRFSSFFRSLRSDCFISLCLLAKIFKFFFSRENMNK